jgi:hypothetical protein
LLSRVGAVLLALLSTLPALPAEESRERPSFQFLRQRENWSVLADGPLDPSDPFDAVKYVKLDRSGSLWVSFGGSARARFEGWQGFDFGIPQTDDDVFSLWRVMAHADFRFGPRVRLFAQAKSALAAGRDLPGGSRTIDLDTLAMQQGFVEVGVLDDPQRLVLRAGRQSLQYGRQRLVSPLPWGNTLRAWDGGMVRFRGGAWRADGFWTRPVIVSSYDRNEADDDTAFWGAYATRSGTFVTEAYLLVFETEDRTYNGTTGAEDRYTIGSRVQGKIGGSRGPLGEVEAAVQFGSVGSGDVAAWMLTLDATWTLGRGPAAPDLGFSIDMATGDRTPGGDVETFNQLYPLGHAWLGIADFIGRQNIQALSGRLGLRPAPKWAIVISPHLFRRFETDDAMYGAGGGVVFPGDAGTSADIGQELDAVASYRFNPHFAIEFGYAHFFAGRFVEQAGGERDIDFEYVQGQFRF